MLSYRMIHNPIYIKVYSVNVSYQLLVELID